MHGCERCLSGALQNGLHVSALAHGVVESTVRLRTPLGAEFAGVVGDCFHSCRTVLAGDDVARDLVGQEVHPLSEQKISHSLPRAAEKGPEFPALGELLAAYAIELAAHARSGDFDAKVPRFTDHPV